MVTTIVATAILVVGQQGQGGFGGGGMAGGAQGGGGANIGDVETSKTHILTPGDRAEWPIEAKAGDVLILRAESQNFDPAITVVDEKGTKLGENDDEEPGMQNARLLVHFAKDGKYKALVSNYRSNAGGQYTFFVTRFASMDGSLSKVSAWKPVENGDRTPAVRVEIDKDAIVSFRPKNGYFSNVTGPNGMPVPILQEVRGRYGLIAFETKVKGDYYLHCQGGSKDNPIEIRPSLAKVRKVSPSSRTASTVGEGELDVWQVDSKERDLLQVSTESARLASIVVAQPEEPRGGPEYTIDSHLKDWSRLATVSRKAGTRTYFVGSTGGPIEYDFVCNAQPITLSENTPLRSKLTIGGSEYYALELKAGTVVTLNVDTDMFDAVLCVINPLGARQEFDDGPWPSRNPSTTFVVPLTGRYIVSVSSNGNGGGGPFGLALTSHPATPIALGQSSEGSPKTPTDSIWDVAIPDDKPVSIRLTGDVRDGQWVLVDPSGASAYPQEIRLSDTDRMFVLVKPKPGAYRLWLRGMKVGGKYKIRVDRFG